MHPLKVAKLINLKIKELDEHKKELENLASRKCSAMANYEKELSKEIFKKIGQYPASLIEKLAKGDCADLKSNADLCEAQYKNCIEIIRITEAQLNGFQSINRYLSEV